MRFFVLLVGITSAMAAPSGMTSFKINGYSRSNVPEMSVTFENGVSDDLVLEPYSKSPCNFIGTLKNFPGTAAVTGCLNNPEDKMHITLLTSLNTKSAMYELDFHGRLTALENPFKYQKESSGILAPVMSRCINDTFGLDDDEMGDELEDLLDELEAEEEFKTSKAVSWPTSVYAYVKFGYENTMKAQLDSDGTTFATYIDSVMTHVQTYYKHETLPTQVLFKYDTSETLFENKDWPGTDYLDDACAVGQADGDDRVDLYAWFGKDTSYYGTVGLAYVGTACKDFYKTSFNEFRNTAVETAMVVAHEMGHNLGMSHDFDAKHGGDNGACNGDGIMSYGDAPAQWSSCSVSDFTGYYELKNWGTTCLKDWDAYVPPCEDACPGTSCTINPDSFCENPDNYGGCTGPYQSYFEAFCKGTCGLC